MGPQSPDSRTARADGAAASKDAAANQPPEAPGAAISDGEEERLTASQAAEPDPGEAAADPADHEEAQALQGDLAALQAKARERDEYLALAQRAQADFENYRKRTSKDVATAEARGISKLARELLPALDNLALALAAAESGAETEHDRGLLAGIRLVQSELAGALERLGIEAYSPAGERFDPELHEAMAQQPVQGAEPGTIVEVYQPGYRHNGGLLRAARVVVAQ
jgi:molecular chaperone GrpE